MGCLLIKKGDEGINKTVDFKCIPERLVFNSEEYKIYGCSVNSFDYPDIQVSKYNTVTIKGNIQELNLGVEYTVKARETVDKYGVGYEVINIKRDKPRTLADTRNFLYEILTAQQTDTLLEIYPDIVDRIINNRLDDVDLNKTKGIKDYTFNVIKRKVIENFKLADLVEEFRGMFSLSIIKKLYDKYPSVEKIKEVIRTEPYECLCGLSGIGFKTADGMLLALEKECKQCQEIGEKPILFFGFDLRSSYQRAKACVNYILNESENDGNTYLKIGELKKLVKILVPEAISNLPIILKGDNDAIFDRELLIVCRKTTYETEKYIARRIKEGLSINTKWDCDYTKFRSLEGFDLTSDQCKTSEFMCKHNIVMLVGYAGSGKTSSTQAFVNLLKHYHKSFLLLAPTGRAAKVLTGFTGENTMTIHRGLGYMPPTDWCYNEENKLPYDVVIVDEFSMVDIFLFRHLLEAIDFNRTKILLIGDDAQIPSVGAGNVLYDLLKCKEIPIITLDKVFRYGKGGLSTVATDTRTSTEYLDKSKNGMQIFGEDQSYIFMPLTQEKLVNYTVQLYTTLLSKGYSVEDIAVLSCYNVGDYGTVEMNKRIQNAVNPNPDAKITFGDSEFRLNDIVMNFANDYKAILYNEEFLDEKNTTFIANGESGRVVKILKDAMVVDYDGTLIYVPKGSMKNIRLGYAISIHKCLPKDTLIYTTSGIRELCELNNNASVYEMKTLSKEYEVYNGFFTEKPTGFYNAGISECRVITTKRGYELTGTLDHKIDVINSDGYIVQKELKDICIGDYALINKKNNVFSDADIMPDINMDFMFLLDNRSKIYKVPMKMTQEFALLLGLIAADGCICKNGRVVTHGKNQKEVSDKFVELIEKLFGYKATNNNVLPNGILGGMYLTSMDSVFINKYLSQIGGLQVNNKYVPDCILKSSKKIQCAFLKGLFEDGSVNIKRGVFDHIEFCSHNKKLIEQVRIMLLNFGIITTTNFRVANYYLYIYKRDARIFYKEIGFISFEKQENLLRCMKDCNRYSTNYRIPNIICRVRACIHNLSKQELRKLSNRERELLRRESNLISEKALTDIMQKLKLPDDLVNDIEYLIENVYLDEVVKIENTKKQCYCIEMPITHKFIQNGFIGSNCQGSQVRIVILITPKTHTFSLNSNLLYVGESRAKEKCYHLGEIKTVNNALKKKENFDRKTMLYSFLQGG